MNRIIIAVVAVLLFIGCSTTPKDAVTTTQHVFYQWDDVDREQPIGMLMLKADGTYKKLTVKQAVKGHQNLYLSESIKVE